MINNSKKLVSVVMPVYNSEGFVKKAIESILYQTYKEFELIVINDGSTDNSDQIIRTFNDNRIKYIANAVNKGIVASLNEGLALCKGKYIARMDADDIALPTRLAKQVDFLETHLDFKLCGSKAIAIDEDGSRLNRLNRPVQHDRIKAFNLFRNAFIHPTVMADAIIFKQIGFAEDYKYAEDYFTFSQFAMHFNVANLEEPLLLYRLHNESITAKKNEEMIKSELKTMGYLLSFLFESVSIEMLQLHHSILRPPTTPYPAEAVHDHLLGISNANKAKSIFAESILAKQLQKEWYEYLNKSKTPGALKLYLTSPLFGFKNFLPKHFFKLAFK